MKYNFGFICLKELVTSISTLAQKLGFTLLDNEFALKNSEFYPLQTKNPLIFSGKIKKIKSILSIIEGFASEAITTNLSLNFVQEATDLYFKLLYTK